MKKFLAILIILIVGVAGYHALNRDNFSRYSFPDFGNENIVSDFFRGIEGGGSAGSVLSQVDLMINAKNGLLEKAADKAESVMEEIISDFKLETFEKIKTVINDKVDDVGKSVGISAGTGKAEEINPVAFSVKSGILAYFTLANRDNDKIDYEVNWQDGNKDEGMVEIGGKKVLSHKWAKAGEYSIQFKINTKGEEKNYQFIISIF